MIFRGRRTWVDTFSYIDNLLKLVTLDPGWARLGWGWSSGWAVAGAALGLGWAGYIIRNRILVKVVAGSSKVAAVEGC